MTTAAATATFAVADLPPRPYPGLRPFRADEWPLFFGREVMIDDVISGMLERRLVVVHGSSGCGKSSLVEAGVVARLQQERVPGAPGWRWATMRPGTALLQNLATALASLGTSVTPDRALDVRRALNQGRGGARLVAEILRRESADSVCVILDQFEELFRYKTVSRDEVQLFTDVLVGFAEDPPDGVYVLTTLRSEFLGDCARFPGLAESFNKTQYLLPRMTRPNLMRAIQEPAWLYGGEVAPDLAATLVHDAAASEDELPVIQHALMLLWSDAERRALDTGTAGVQPHLSLEDYEKREGLVALMSAHADQIANQVAPDPKAVAVLEEVFRALTDINADGHAVRRPQQWRDLLAVAHVPDSMLRRMLNPFRVDGVSFLTPYAPKEIQDDTFLDVSHEALIRRWTRVANEQDGWIHREFADGLVWKSLLVQAYDFELDASRVLSAAATEDRERWIQGRTPAWSQRYGGNWEHVQTLLAASRRTFEQRAEREREEERQRLEQSVKTRQAEREARAQRKRLVAALCLMALALLGTAWALVERSQAERSRKEAEAARSLAEEKGTVAQQKTALAETQSQTLAAQTVTLQKQTTDVKEKSDLIERQLAELKKLRASEKQVAQREQALLSERVAQAQSAEKAAQESAQRIRDALNRAESSEALANARGEQLSQQVKRLQASSLANLAASLPQTGTATFQRGLLAVESFVRNPTPEAAAVIRDFVGSEQSWNAEGRSLGLDRSRRLNAAGSRFLLRAAGGLRVLDAATGAEQMVVAFPNINAAAISPDGQFIAAAGDKEALIRRVDRGLTTRGIDPDRAQITLDGAATAIDFNTASTQVAIAAGRVVKVLTISGGPLHEFAHQRTVRDVRFDRSGRRLASVDDRGHLKIHNLQTGTSLEVQTRLEDPGVILSPDGATILVVGEEAPDTDRSQVLAYSTATLAPLWKDATAEFINPDGVDFSPDGRLVAVGDYSGRIRVIDANKGQIVKRWSHRDDINALTFSPDGKSLLSGNDDGAIVWTLEGKIQREFYHPEMVFWVGFAQPDASRGQTSVADHGVLTVDLSGRSRGFRLDTDAVLANEFDEASRRSDFAADVGKLVFVDAAYRLILYDLRAGSVSGRRGLGAVPVDFVDITISPDGRLAAVLERQGVAEIRDAATGEIRHRIQGPSGAQWLGFSSGGGWLVWIGDKEAALVQLGREPSAVVPLKVGAGTYFVRFTPDDRHVIATDREGTVQMLTLPGLSPVWSAKVGSKETLSLSVSRGGDLFAISTADGSRAAVYRVANGTLVCNIAHNGAVRAVAFDGTTAYFGSASDDRTARITRLDGCTAYRVIQHTDLVRDLAFVPGSMDVVTLVNRTVSLWNTTPNPSTETDRIPVTTGGRLRFSPDGHLVIHELAGGVSVRVVGAKRLLDEACRVVRERNVGLTPTEWKTYLPEDPYAPVCGAPSFRK